MREFFGKNYQKNLAPKITRLINTRYLSLDREEKEPEKNCPQWALNRHLFYFFAPQ